MNSPSTSMRRTSARIGDAVLLAAALAAMASLLLAAARLNSEPVGFITTAIFNPNPLELTPWPRVDRAVFAAAPPQGNFLATLPELAPADQQTLAMAAAFDARAASALWLATAFHPRAVYILWPRRMFVAPPDTVLITPAQLAAAKPPDDPQWLAQHDVRAAVRFHLVNGQILVQPVALPSRP